MKRHTLFTVALLAALFSDTVLAQENAIRLNQIGFYPHAQKRAVVVSSPADVFFITAAQQGDTLYSGTLQQEQTWSPSGENVRLADFSTLKEQGSYKLVVPGLGASYTFEIADSVHHDLALGALKGFYFQRASAALPFNYAGFWFRNAGHPDTEVEVHPSAATAQRPAGTIVSAPRGWYDAGDFNKYIVNSGISTYTMLAAYEHFPDYYASLKTNIPESENDIPDILDEALWNLRWMLTMQDPHDGGVYHKLTHANFSGTVMPHEATAKRYVVQKSTAAALDFAAVMAQSARVFSAFETAFPGFADSCLTASLAAWGWARKNPAVYYDQNSLNSQYNPDINTGAYGDGNVTDEFAWAAAELSITTGADSFLTGHDPLEGWAGVPAWPNVNTLALISLNHFRIQVAAFVDTSAVKSMLLSLANDLSSAAGNSAYAVPMGGSQNQFVWGSNSVAANQGLVLIQAFLATGDSSYLQPAMDNLDYLLGRNGTGYCYVTGFGDKPPLHIHHRQSEADIIPDPVPGLLAGGPNPGRQDGCSGYIGEEPARSYVDSYCSYASNEIAINWNAPLVYLSGAIEALNAGKTVSTISGNATGRRPPRSLRLLGNYPNPFNPTTTVLFELSFAAEISVDIYDIKGQRVAGLWKGTKAAGRHTLRWDARGHNGRMLSSGVYFLKIETDKEALSKKLVLLR